MPTRPSTQEPTLTQPFVRETPELQMEFELSPAHLADGADPASMSVMKVGLLLSQGRLRFRVGLNDFAEGSGGLPLLNFALDLRALLTGLRPEDHERLLLGSSGLSLHWIRIGEAVRVTGGADGGRTAMLPYEEAVGAGKAFLGSVARELLGRYPALLRHKELTRLTVA